MTANPSNAGYLEGLRGVLGKLSITSLYNFTTTKIGHQTFDHTQEDDENYSYRDFPGFDDFTSDSSILSATQPGDNLHLMTPSDSSISENTDSVDVPSFIDDDNELNDGIESISDLELASSHTRSEFDRLFGNIEYLSTERLYKAYVCALSKEILYHGKMFITTHHVCFFSRVFNTQKLVIPFNEIVKIEPKMTMFFIPNAIAIQTVDDSRYVFASFNNRNRTMNELKRLRNTRVNDDTDLYSPSINGDFGDTGLNCGSGNAEGQGVSPNAVSSTSISPVKKRIRSSSNTSSQGKLRSYSGVHSGVNSSRANLKTHTGEAFSTFNTSGVQPFPMVGGVNESNDSHPKTKFISHEATTKWPVENLGPEEHPKTVPPEEKANEKILNSEIIEAPLGVVANILFGKDTSWYKHFLVDVEKNRNLKELPHFNEFKPGEERSFEYTKALNGAVGPKNTHCQSVERIENWDLENYIEVVISSATPDVPSGSSFTTLTRVVLSWSDGNATQIRLGTWLEWTGKSWLKGPIERGAFDGQCAYCKSLVRELRSKISASRLDAVDNKHLKQVDVDGEDEKHRQRPIRRSSNNTHAAAIREWQQLCIGLSITTLILLVLLIFVWLRSRQGSKVRSVEDERNLMRIQQELELWQWIDGRKDPGMQKKFTLTQANIEEAIAATEKRLANLKASLMS